MTILTPLFILGMAELILRMADYGDNFDLFVPNPVEGYEKYMVVNPVIGKKYFSKLEYTSPANDMFLKEKPDSSFRVFVMGSSVVYGFPYERNLMFSRILHARMEDKWPDLKIEMVNTAITAINSFTLLDYTPQILREEPDAILIYAGHNEFYGAFGIGSNETMSKSRFITQTHLLLLDLKLYQLVRNLILGVSESISGEQTHGTLMKRIVARKDILFQSREYRKCMVHYEKNLDRILQLAGSKGVPVFLGTLSCNLNGMEPFQSLATQSLPEAIEVYREAQKAEKEGQFEKAHDLYSRARDLDGVRFRASSEVNDIIRRLALKHKAFLVPVDSVFEEASPNRLVGNNLFTEHVHPNIDGSFLMADAYYKAIINSGTLHTTNAGKEYGLEYLKKNWGYTVLDSLLAAHRLEILKRNWPFVKEGETPADYRKIYKPKDRFDSLSFSIVRNSSLNLADIRLELAEELKKEGRVREAYMEYLALLRQNPYVAINYRDVANVLLQMEDLPGAYHFFEKSVKLEPSFYAFFRMGEIMFLKGDYNNAALFIERSFSLAPAENKINVAGKLYHIYKHAGETQKARAMETELKKAKAGRFLLVPPKNYVYTNYIPLQTRWQVTEARELIKKGRLQNAIELLEASLQIYDSHIARRMLGEIHREKGVNTKA